MNHECSIVEIHWTVLNKQGKQSQKIFCANMVDSMKKGEDLWITIVSLISNVRIRSVKSGSSLQEVQDLSLHLL